MYAGEKVERALEALLQANLATALDTVETRWTGDTAQSLPDVVNWTRGYRAWVLELPSTYYPYVVTILMLQDPEDAERRRPGGQYRRYQASVVVFLVADTEAEVITLAHRYAEAIQDVLESQRYLEGYGRVNYVPRIFIPEGNAMHLRAGVSGDAQDPDDVDFIRALELTTYYEGG